MNTETSPLRIAIWTVVIGGLTAVHMLAFLAVVGGAKGALLSAVVAGSVISPVGALWALSHWFVQRRQKIRWQTWMFVLLIPYGFLWYLFEKWEPTPSPFDKFHV